MKNINVYRWIFVIALIFVFISFLSGEIVKFQYREDLISPYPSNFKLDLMLYYVGDDHLLHGVLQSVEINQNKYVESIVRALKNQPDIEGLSALLPEEFMINSYRNTDRKLYIDISESIKNSRMWKNYGADLMVYGFCNSLISLDNVDAIVLTIDGVFVSDFTSFNDKYGELRFSNEYLYTNPQTTEEVLDAMLRYMKIGRYELAFELTTLASRQVDMPEYFKQMAIEYARARRNYNYIIDKNIFYDALSGEYHIKVNYYDDDWRTLDKPQEEIWKMRFKDDEYRIIWEYRYFNLK